MSIEIQIKSWADTVYDRQSSAGNQKIMGIKGSRFLLLQALSLVYNPGVWQRINGKER